MDSIIPNKHGSERSVESIFIIEMLQKYGQNKSVLDVGGIPTHIPSSDEILEGIKNLNLNYKIADFRGGNYQGDFVTMDIPEKFDIVMFISSLEHFPQCTEGDMIYRPGEDKKGFEKALTLLREGGLIFLTVPFGKPLWQNYHQNYDMKLINQLTSGTKIVSSYIYKLVDDNWIQTKPQEAEDSIYTTKASAVGCFVLSL